MSWRRKRVMGQPLKPMEKWRSLKVGDVVMLWHNAANRDTLRFDCVMAMVAERRHRYVTGEGTPGRRTWVARKGLFLDLAVGDAIWIDLDDDGVRGVVVRGGGR